MLINYSSDVTVQTAMFASLEGDLIAVLGQMSSSDFKNPSSELLTEAFDILAADMALNKMIDVYEDRDLTPLQKEISDNITCIATKYGLM